MPVVVAVEDILDEAVVETDDVALLVIVVEPDNV